jgi:serine/alanine adding enzyme
MIETYTLTTSEADRWRTVLPADLSVTGSLEYLRICEQQSGWAARLFVVEDGRPVAAYPYLVRPVSALPFEATVGSSCSDICTPEYRGPLWLNGGFPEGTDAPRFADLFARHCREQRIIAEFAHLNPWTVPEELLEPGCVTADRDIVYVDLTRTEEEIWMHSLSSDARRQTKQGQRAGVHVRRAVSADDVREFYRLYTHTMERRDALDRYFYPLEYFMAFFETMPANAFFLLAEHEDRVVAGGLYFQDRTNIHWHLSAADREFVHLRPVNVYLYESIRQALGQGRERMIMGGGYGKDDGVFRFKANFSPLRARFCTYRRVHDAESYAALTEAWSAHHGGIQPGDGFFPAYRSTPPADVPMLEPVPMAVGKI